MQLKYLVIITLLFFLFVLYIPNNEKSQISTEVPDVKGEIITVSMPKVSLESMFSSIGDRASDSLSDEDVIELFVTGDVNLARTVNFQIHKYDDVNWPYAKLSDEIKRADLLFINLETPLIEDCQLTNTGMKFCGDKKDAEGLAFIGVDIASIANNHADNYGKDGVDDTMKALTDNNILVTGVDGVVYKTVKNTKFAFLGYNDVETEYNRDVSTVEDEKMKRGIKDAKNNSDIVVVMFHWGYEYHTQPNDRQKYLAHLAIDNGADLVVGNHPHWIQPVEVYKDKVIMYSHGNFIFDQEWSKKTKQGIVGKYVFYNKKLVDVEFLPVLIENYGQARFMEGKDKEDILNELEKESVKLKE